MRYRTVVATFVLVTVLLVGVGTVGAQEDVPVEDGRFDDAIKTDDGYVIAGTLQPEGETLDGYGIKIDEDGNEIWSFLRGEDDVDYLSSVVETDDGFVFAGAKGAPNKNVKGNAWVVKTDDEGNVEWEETYAGERRSSFYTVQALDDGYVAMGSSNEDGGIVVRLDENGEEMWNRSHGIVIGDSLRTENGLLLAGGKRGSSGLVTWFAEMDDGGELVWERTYDAGQNRFSTILPVESGYMLGTHRSNEVVKVGEEGEHDWTAEVDMQYVYDIEQIEEDRFAVGGGIPTSGMGELPTSVVEIDSEGETIRERDFGYSITEVLNPDIEEGEYVVVAQGVENDALAVVLEPDETASGENTGSEGGDEGAESDATDGDEEADGDGTGETSDDANPLGSPAQTALKFVGAVVLVVFALGYRRT
ncbi:MAG: hypothetical protein U5J64_00865 [Halobacteriales archaeon]|nr:hypothetical protein [Halobacteriales archaeon]